MANITVNSYYKHRTFCYQGNQVGINVRYLKIVTAAGVPVTETAFITTLDTLFATLYKPWLSTTGTYVGSDIQDITGTLPFPVQVGSNANNGPGTQAGQPLPAQVSGLIKTQTMFTGRGYRGRCYIPFPASQWVQTGPPPVVSAAGIAVLTAIADATFGTLPLTVAGNVITYQWLLRHGNLPGVLGTYTPLINAIPVNSWATQKRRGDYGRTNPMPTP